MIKATDINLNGPYECSLFAASATHADIEKLCAEAREKPYRFRAVCVNGSRVELARTFLEDSAVEVVGLVGFPLGAGDADAKRYETEIAVDHGAHEIDFVINLGRLKDGDHQYVLREMRDIVEAADERPVKAVLETHLLTREEKILMCHLAIDSGVRFVSTATDFHSPAVAIEDVRLLHETLAGLSGIRVKAVGGIRDTSSAMELLQTGAIRIGVLPGVDLLGGLEA